MVDYTTKQNSGGWGAGVVLAAVFVVAMLVYGIFATGGPATVDPTTPDVAPAALDAAPVATE
jgi:hypothetical protein